MKKIINAVLICCIIFAFSPNMTAFATSNEHAALMAYREFLTTKQTVYLEIIDEVIPWEFESGEIRHAELIDFNNDGMPKLFIILENRFIGGAIVIPYIVVGYTEQVEVLFGRLAFLGLGHEHSIVKTLELAITEDGLTYIVRSFLEWDKQADDAYILEREYFALKNDEFVSVVAFEHEIYDAYDSEYVYRQIISNHEEFGIIGIRELNFQEQRDAVILSHEIERILDPSIPAIIFARPTTATVRLNEQNWGYGFRAYNIEGHNFFQLREVAYVLNGTESQFEVSWDSENNAILITTGESYTPVGREMSGRGVSRIREAIPTSATIFINGTEANLTAYHIDGNNYFMLRELGALIGFDVDWDGERQTILINTR